MTSRHSHLTLAGSLGLCAALLFSLFWLFLPPSTLFAQSQPEALGSISGVVRNEQGQPLSNINVSLYQPVTSGNTPIRVATTNAQGAYKLLSIPPGAYQIRFQDNGKLYTGIYYTNGTTQADATMVNVSGNDVSGIDMKLTPGGTISVTIEPALPITDSSLTLYLFAKTSTGHWGAYDTIIWPYTTKDLAFYGVPSGSYRLCAQPASTTISSDWSECFDNVFFGNNLPPDDATDIIIQGAMHKTVAFTFGDISQLQGFVRSNDGKPLANIQLSLKSILNNGISVADAQTDASGHFQFGRIYSQEYTLQAFDPHSEYLPAFYENASTLQQARPIKIDSTSRYSLTLTMPRAGGITGKITLEGGGAPYYAQIRVYKKPLTGDLWDNSEFCINGGCFTNYEMATGIYTITGLATGTYRVQASVWSYPDHGSSAFYGGNELQTARDIAVTASKNTPNINITIGTGEFDSAIQGAATANGAPAAGIEVGLFDIDPTFIFPMYMIVKATTDAQGKYHFDGLTTGDYAVGFRDPKGVYGMTFYGGSPITPTRVLITDTMIVTGINAALTPGATIRGKVIRAPGRNPADIEISAIVPPYYTLTFLNVDTDIHGNFEIESLPPGSYWVAAQAPQDAPMPYVPRYYPNGPGFDTSNAQTVTVGPGDVATGIDIPIDIAPTAYLPTIEANGTPPVR